MGHNTPSFYNSIEMDKYKRTSPKYDWKVSKTKRIEPLKRTAKDQPETSPSTYKPDESLKARVLQSSPRFSYPKEKGKSFIARYQAQKAFVPAPCAYNTDAAYSKVTIGARRGYK